MHDPDPPRQTPMAVLRCDIGFNLELSLLRRPFSCFRFVLLMTFVLFFRFHRLSLDQKLDLDLCANTARLGSLN